MKRSTIYLIFTICLFAAIAVPSYFGYQYFIHQGNVKSLERELSLEQTKLELLRQEGEVVDVADSQRLQTRVPTEAALDTVVETLSQASQLSDVRVTSIAFADGVIAESEVPEDIDEPESNDVSATAEPAEPVEITPVNASSIRSTVSLQADTYESLVLFLESVESMNRIHILRTVQFTGPTETGPNTTETAEPLDFTVELDAFYRPDLDQLTDDRYVPAQTFTPKDIPVYDYTTP
ncbi:MULTISPECIES: hypothetical protein [unclassified Exiguobacterium]|uniref:hypothetical protein n=1 Tax=unclassified Exiguobacterium TaxID=2644629 RepID=UPI0010393A39|nr:MULTISPECIES: hypothetical protein [unclassified Exiguobacterium]TCI73666.1 hypothetical protein EVJ19_00565 [Exiguobacterium sp. IPCI3]TCI82824.1 hypothetical protein EVJ18_00565 [Exiguobacterium sp. IPCH1]TCI83878.1 hypothetical protein EVJ17_00565 [Exiguobacterium sp. IPBC4]